ncbi:uncharacterized protein K489DRAFT_371097 [Dissoconium aciculare CBS 342.82]|uniref:Uncharacterized protein n=1 Tax=Dissoconium aciculare CBS 342.82 TaxID=1314786 RepID=A0A6J3M5W8_9PEZI|nr:uncharacterized protein K489DRAFT_371097 [Dissoconium aciculare CBS 342.82]KAF1822242.1 hypothetical protein K489DRAFT_371097 [Dissoconium aciculare CBS 342.82]
MYSGMSQSHPFTFLQHYQPSSGSRCHRFFWREPPYVLLLHWRFSATAEKIVAGHTSSSAISRRQGIPSKDSDQVSDSSGASSRSATQTKGFVRGECRVGLGVGRTGQVPTGLGAANARDGAADAANSSPDAAASASASATTTVTEHSSGSRCRDGRRGSARRFP